MTEYHKKIAHFVPAARSLSKYKFGFLTVYFLIALFIGVGHGIATEEAAEKDQTTLFYASFDESLEANDAKGEWDPKDGQPNITMDNGGVRGEALDLTPLEYPLGYTTLSYGLMENLSLNEGTVEFWYKPEFNRIPDGERPFISYFLFDVPTTLRDKNNQVIRAAITISENGGVRKVSLVSGMKEEEGVPVASAVVDWSAGEWHHVAMTWNAEEILLYLDGIPVASIYSKNGLFGGNEEAVNSLVGKFCVGGAWSTSAGVSAGGCIDEFRISNQALKPGQFRSSELLHQKSNP